ncbi:copper amine oxidase [Paenibacillus ginsengarvi]|uniref:Copper amine oxidase n=2 Tax=Paenibacillus ginsengarvi TaxID=400777 RepID=A0A3B0C4Z7_9BACL|nr:copper amine oxidase [Paenibacillus ginsengarvi]
MVVGPWVQSSPIYAATAAESPVLLTAQEPLTYGAIRKTYDWSFVRNKQPVSVKVNVVEVDLKNPYVKLDTVVGTGGQLTKKQNVRKMANETGAVAAINGDFFNTKAEGVPMGPQVSGGKLVATPPYLTGWYSFALTKENKPVIDMFTFQGKIVARDGASYPLGGINKTYYWYENDGVHEEGGHSMVDGLYMYTSTWGQADRSNDGVTVPTEILVQNGIIKDIRRPGIFEMVAPADGYILRASGKADEFVAQHLKVGEPIFSDYRMLSQDPAVQYDAASFKTMIGGHTILVDGGQPAPFSHEVGGVSGYSPVARTAIGYSQNEQYAYLIAADTGLTLPELQQFMVQIGVYKGMNLDGGGSTQMAARPLGEFQTSLVSADVGYERPVVNGLAVYSLSPKGQVRDVLIQGATTLFIGQKATYSLKAYDDYYNSVKADEIPASWTSSQPIGAFQGNVFTASAAGKTKLTVASGKATKSIDVEVIGGKDIASLKLSSSSTSLMANSVYTLTASVQAKSGAKANLPVESMSLEFIGFKGRVEGNRLMVDSIDKDVTEGRIIARYDGFSTMLTMPIVDSKVAETFDGMTPITFTSTAGVVGSVYKATGLEGTKVGNQALVLQYDFTKGTGTTVAYAKFADGLKIEGQPESFSVKVKGDSSRNWIRAEVVDSAGKTQLIGLSEFANWSDWKTLSADLTKYNFAYPITMTRLYVANPENGHDERELKGQIAFDDLAFEYKKSTPAVKNIVKLTVDQKSLTVNGKSLVLDQAPVIYKDNTLVPVRFVVEAMGGQLTWVDEQRKVIIVKDNHLLELWLDKTELIADGEAVTAEVPPLLMTERTMVPLRIISEKMGWKVTWDEKTRGITLE